AVLRLYSLCPGIQCFYFFYRKAVPANKFHWQKEGNKKTTTYPDHRFKGRVSAGCTVIANYRIAKNNYWKDRSKYRGTGPDGLYCSGGQYVPWISFLRNYFL